jgi:hypothetical protein
MKSVIKGSYKANVVAGAGSQAGAGAGAETKIKAPQHCCNCLDDYDICAFCDILGYCVVCRVHDGLGDYSMPVMSLMTLGLVPLMTLMSARLS